MRPALLALGMPRQPRPQHWRILRRSLLWLAGGFALGYAACPLLFFIGA